MLIMIKYPFLCLLVIITSSAIAQSTKAYIDKNGHSTNKIQDAMYYVLYQKIQDTVYMLKQFDMSNELLAEGCYKDSLRTIPNGKFIYYGINYKPSDTSNYVRTIGYYSNGLQSGVWIYYSGPSVNDFICSYQKGKLNGMYKKYYPAKYNDCVGLEGPFVNDKKEGEWKQYDTLGTITVSSTFRNDSLVSQIFHTRDALPPDNFSVVFFKSINKIVRKYSNTGLFIMFSVNIDGSITDVHFDLPVSADNAKFIADALIATGKFQPAIQNDRPIISTYKLEIRRAQDPNRTPDNMMRSYSQHTDLIGRGLNAIGIGTPVDDRNPPVTHH